MPRLITTWASPSSGFRRFEEAVAANTTTYANSGLTTGTDYYYEVLAYNGQSQSDTTAEVDGTALPPTPSAPTGLSASVFSNSQINLSWTDHDANQQGVIVEESMDGGSTFSQVASLTGSPTSYSVANLNSGLSYIFRVAGYNSGVNSSYSNTASGTTTLPAPSGLSATAANNNEVNLSWTDNDEDESGFVVQQSTDGTTWTQVDSPGAQAGTGQTVYDSIGGLSVNTAYQFRVASIAGSVTSTYTSVANVTTLNQTVNYSQAFSSTASSEWSPSATFVDAAIPSNYILGPIQYNGTATLNLSNLPAGDDSFNVSFGLYALNHWGDSNPTITVKSGGTTVLSTSLSSLTPTQTGVDHDADHSGAFSSASVPDSVYSISVPAFMHNGSTDAITFTSTGGGTGTHDGFALDNVSVSVARPTVSIAATTNVTSATGTGGPGVFTVSIPSALPDALPVSFNLGGTEPSSQYTVTDANGSTLNGSVTIPAGSTSAQIDIKPTATTTPDWTNTVTAQVTQSASSPYASSTTQATVDVTGAPPTIVLGDGSANQVLQGSSDGTKNLVPLHLTFPQNLKPGATITLSESEADEADVWTTATASGKSGELLLGGNQQSAVTWTVGGTQQPPPATLWVGAYHGSHTVGDIVFTLRASDTNSPAATTAPAVLTATTSAATAIKIGIVSSNVPIATNPSGDIAGRTRNWIIGQRVITTADVEGPSAWTSAPTFAWSVPGNVLHEYNHSMVQGDVAPLQPDNGDGTGTAAKTVNFFWTSTANGVNADNNNVSVTIGNINGSTYSAATTYIVSSPTIVAAGTSATEGAVTVVGPARGKSLKPFDANTLNGFDFSALVASPNSVGKIGFVQLATAYLSYADPTGAVWATITPPALQLDGTFPYQFQSITGLGGAMVDRPALLLFKPPFGQLKSGAACNSDDFSTYVMYQPPGKSSEYVPIIDVKWDWYGIADKVNRRWVLNVGKPASTINLTYSSASTEPQWVDNTLNRNATFYKL